VLPDELGDTTAAFLVRAMGCAYFGGCRSPVSVDLNHAFRLISISGFGDDDRAFRLMLITR
jgi:hypothetical protein